MRDKVGILRLPKHHHRPFQLADAEVQQQTALFCKDIQSGNLAICPAEHQHVRCTDDLGRDLIEDYLVLLDASVGALVEKVIEKVAIVEEHDNISSVEDAQVKERSFEGVSDSPRLTNELCEHRSIL